MAPPSPDEILADWHGLVENNFFKTIAQIFALPKNDTYIYKTESFAMTLPQIQKQLDTGLLKYKYRTHGQVLDIPITDIDAYTSIFSPTTSTPKALTAFTSNAKKSSPRETVSKYLSSTYMPAPLSTPVPKSKTHKDPYYDLWVFSCELTGFLGPLPDASYADPREARISHPILPVFYHHFGCAVPSFEALWIIQELAKESGGREGVIDMASGNGYWTFMLRRLGVSVEAVDNMESEYRTRWILDTIKADGVEFLERIHGGRGRVLLCVYMVTAGDFMEKVLRVYKGDTIVVVGTQNNNRFTGFEDCRIEEWFQREGGWTLWCRIPLPSFAGKDEGMEVWRRDNERG